MNRDPIVSPLVTPAREATYCGECGVGVREIRPANPIRHLLTGAPIVKRYVMAHATGCKSAEYFIAKQNNPHKRKG